MNCETCANSTMCQAPCNGGAYVRKWWLKIGDHLFSQHRGYRRWVGGVWCQLQADQPVGPPSAPWWRERQDHHQLPAHIRILSQEYWDPAKRPVNKLVDLDQ